ncbi:unnamed protein product [Lactuca virosa]|uniref:Uncharacterized protein n=1 Tax=Lactuca virosa TaxID=75947 RepID=A0AAU9PD97_9ASTR|nr:unnamed protein product [Lactuca virosa]
MNYHVIGNSLSRNPKPGQVVAELIFLPHKAKLIGADRSKDLAVLQIKGVTNNYPLKIIVRKVSVEEETFDPDYLKRAFFTINWDALVYASNTLGYTELPDKVPDASVLDSNEFLKKFHHALLELQLEEGVLLCPETYRRFPVKNGSPNMILREDEMRLPSKEEAENRKAEAENRKAEAEKIAKKKMKRAMKEKKKEKQEEPPKKIEMDWIAKFKPKIEFVPMSSDTWDEYNP